MWMRSVTSLFLIIVALQHATSTAAEVKHYEWTINYSFWSPDCVERLLIAINGQYPGPTIRAHAGDTIIVKVQNLIPTEGLVIHWHGIRQIGTPWFDGTASVSQCAIVPGETFVYKFLVDKAGTFFYHGHYGMQRSAGLYGSLIVEVPRGMKEPFSYDGELSVVLNDWWHKSSHDQEIGLLSIPFRWVGEPQSLLIEGRGSYNCSLVPGGAAQATAGDSVACNASNPQCSPFVLAVQPGKTYRLRIASVASLSSLNFVIEGHTMTVVEADGYYIEPVEVENLDVYSGESFSILFTANQQADRNYWVATHVRGRVPNTPPGLAILNYIPNPSTVMPPGVVPGSPAWNDTAYSVAQRRQLMASHNAPPPPSATDLQLPHTLARDCLLVLHLPHTPARTS